MDLETAWTDEEIATFTRRNERFLKMGMTELNAEKLAADMLDRDRPVSGDDRRLCLECAHFGLKRGTCAKRGYLALPTILQRCDGFSLRGAA